MKIKCLVADVYGDVTQGKMYDATPMKSGIGVIYTDDIGDRRSLHYGLECGDWEILEEDLTETPSQFPVGTQCQARTQQNGFWCRWKDITVLGYYEDLIWFSHGDSDFTGKLSQVELREKNSERERYVEKVAPTLYHSYEPDEKGMEILAGHLYDLGFKLPDEET